MSGRPRPAAEDRGALRRSRERRFIGGSVVVSGERIAPGPPVGVSPRHEAAAYVAGSETAQRSAGYVSFDVPVMRTVTTHSGRGFRVQARFAGDGSHLPAKARGGFRGSSFESQRSLTVW